MLEKILENNSKTREYLDGLPKIYLVVRWIGYGVLDFPFTGEFVKDGITGEMEPVVYAYNDHNGTADQWELKQITNTTSGWCYCWTERETVANRIADALNEYDNKRKRMR